MDKYGTDALRFTLAALAAQGRDIRLAEERIEGYRNFANKTWNAARLVLANLDGYDPARAGPAAPSIADRWIRSRLNATVGLVRKALDGYRFNDAASAIYQFTWHEVCDWYLEIAKLALYDHDNAAQRARTQVTLVEVLEATLRLLHPFMPFLTEEIWQQLPHAGESIMVAPYPRASRNKADPAAERDMAPVIGVVSAVRNIRSESRVPPSVEVAVTIKPTAARAALIRGVAPLIGALGRCTVTVSTEATRPPHSAFAAVDSLEVFVDLAGVVDLAAERQRLAKEIKKAEDEIAFLEGKLGRPEFVARAPAEVVERERGRLAEQRRLRAKLDESLRATAEGRGSG
jgi:valyl-tRNA synthetase